MTIRKLVLTLVCLALATFFTNHSLVAQFESTYFSNSDKDHYSIIESVTNASNTVVAETITGATLNIHVMEIDGAGNIVNEMTYDSGLDEQAFHIAHSLNGGYVISGVQLFNAFDRGLVIELNAGLVLINQARFHSTSPRHSPAFHIIPTAFDPTPGYVVVGTIAQGWNYQDPKTIYALKLDAGLTKLWERHLNSAAPAGPQDWDMATHVVEIPGQGYFVGGSATATPPTGGGFSDQTVFASKITYANVVSWKTSMDDNGSSTSGHLSIGADAFYNVATNEIYQLANFSINHHFGVVVWNAATGLINPAKTFRVFSSLGYINLDGFRIMESQNPQNYIVAGYLRDGNYVDGNGTFVDGTFPFAVEIDKNVPTILWDEMYPVPSSGYSTSTSPYDAFFAGQQPLNLHPKMALRQSGGSGYTLVAPHTGNAINQFETEILQLDLVGLNPCLHTPLELNPITLNPTIYPVGFTSLVLNKQIPALTIVPVTTQPAPCQVSQPCTVDPSFTVTDLGDCCFIFSDLTPDGAIAGTTNCDLFEIQDSFGNIVYSSLGDVINFCFPVSGTYQVCNTDCCYNSDGTITTATTCLIITADCGQPCDPDPTFTVVSAGDCCIQINFNTPTPCLLNATGATVDVNGDGVINNIDTQLLIEAGCCQISWGDGSVNGPNNTTHCYETSGTYQVCFTACCVGTDGVLYSETYCELVTVDCCCLPFDMGVTVDECTVCIYPIWECPNPTGNITYDYGDGSTGIDPCHTYTASGVYTVCMTACCIGSTGLPTNCVTYCQVVTVVCGCELINPDFSVTIDDCTVCFQALNNGLPADPSEICADWHFDWTGDPFAGAVGLNPCYTYPGSGTYTVCLHIWCCDDVNTIVEVCKTITINCGGDCCPNADFTWGYTPNCYEVQFFGPGCEPFNGTTFWSFGDGGIGSGSNPIHTFPGSGWYTVCLHICCVNADGTLVNTEICHDVYVPECGCVPDADFWWDYYVTADGQCCATFHDLTPDGNPYGCESWVFGLIQSQLAGDDVTFCFPASGYYTVCHYDCCVDAAGNTYYDEVCYDIYIDCGSGCCLPQDFTWTCTDNCCYTFSPLTWIDCIPTGNSFYWTFGDGNVSTDEYPVHCFIENGTYQVCLTVTCLDGTTVSYCHYISVDCAPCINPAQIDPNAICTADYNPVCGCDGVTYPNDCFAFYLGGVTSWTLGPCPQDCIDPTQIDPNMPCVDVVDPVCGCDGNTYTNACYAQYYGGVTTWTAGPCIPECVDPTQIDPNVLCVDLYAPVCGCDGNTYTNACYAQYYGGVTSWTDGPCAPTSGCCLPQDFTYNCEPGCCFSFTPLFLVDCVPFGLDYYWDFGDGSVAFEENPTHCFYTNGVFPVCMTVVCPDGTSVTYCQYITVQCAPICCLPSGWGYAPVGDCCFEFFPEYFLTDCDPAGNQYFWSFGDGSSSNEQNPIHCFPNGGVYTVCLEVICPDGQSWVMCDYITVDCSGCDVALFPNVVQDGCIWTVTFTNSGTTPLNEICVMVENGVVITADQYIQVLDFSNNCDSGWGICYQYWCCNDPNSIPIGICVDYIVNCCCDQQIDFGWETTNDCCLQFFGPGSLPFEGCITWSFGDGSTSNEQNPVHCYGTGGTYQVCLTTCCVDAAGNITGYNTVCHEVTIDCCTLPFEWFWTADDCTVCFAPIYEGPNPTNCILWDFGDGSFGYGVNPCHTYAASGTYAVCMYAWCCNDIDVLVDPTNVAATNSLIAMLLAQGIADVICHDVTVDCPCDVPCIVHAAFNQVVSTGSTMVSFTDLSFAGPGTTIVSWFWDFGDSQNDVVQNPVHVYNQTGDYMVCLTVVAVNDDGTTCEDTICYLVSVPCKGDLTGDGVININDLLLMLAVFASSCP